MPPTRRAALHAIAADAARQLGFSRQSITNADAGLALLPAGDMSDLAVRMRTVRALVSTNVGGIDAATVELTRVIDAIRDRPLALGCVLRDRGWLNFRDGNPDQALDDLLRAYALLRRHASREEAMVAAGRLSMAQFSVRDYPQALSLVDETIAFFREQKAQIRLATALDRRSAILKAAGRLDEALIAATEALRIHDGIGDRVGTGLSQMRMCGVRDRTQCAQAGRRAGAIAPSSRSSQTSGMDDNDYRTLAALRGRLYLALGSSKEAVAQFDRAIAPGGAQPADDIAELYELRSRAHAAVGDYPAAFTDQGEYLRRMREQGTLDRIREVAQLRVQFENDQEKQKIVAAREGQEARRGTAQQPDAHHAAGGDRRPHRPGDRVLPGLRAALPSPASRRTHPARRARRAHRPAQSPRHRAQGGRIPDTRARIEGHADHRAHRSRSFQVDQRPLRPRGRRPAAAALRGGAAHVAAHARGLRPLWRRGIPRAVPGLLAWTRRASRRNACAPRCAISGMRVDDQDVTVTLSLGLASYEAGDVLFDQVARRADIALYVAKTQGRDRVEIFNPARHGGLCAATACAQRQR